MFRTIKSLSTVLALSLAAPALADVPDVITYAGSLKRGGVDADGTFAVTAALFDDAEDGEPLFTQEEASLVVVGGELIIDLGADATNPLGDDVLDREALFLAITVDGEELTPRVPLTSAPYARRAQKALEAETVGGLTADDIAALYTAGPGLAKQGTTFSLATGGVSSVHILDGSVTSADIAVGAVTSTHLAAGAVTGAALANGTIGAAQLANDAVGAAQLANDAVGAAEISANAVGTSEIADGSITSADVAADTLTGADIAAGAIGASELSDGAVGNDELAVFAVSSSKIQSNAVTGTKIAAGAIDGSHLKSGGVLVFREADACPGASDITLASTCAASTCGSIAGSPPVPAGCTCNGTIATCPNVPLGRLVRD